MTSTFSSEVEKGGQGKEFCEVQPGEERMIQLVIDEKRVQCAKLRSNMSQKAQLDNHD